MLECPICAAGIKTTAGTELEDISEHLISFHTMRRIVKELAQSIFQYHLKVIN